MASKKKETKKAKPSKTGSVKKTSVPNPETHCKNGKPRLKGNLTGKKKCQKYGPSKETDGKNGSDLIPTGTVRTDSGTPPVSQVARTMEGTDCLGYDPSLVNGTCRCASCKKKPHAERTKRPFVSTPASTAPPVTSAEPLTKPSVSSSMTPSPSLGKKESSDGDRELNLLTDTAPHVIVIARAGTGKTTTGIEGLKEMLGFKTHITPSLEQKAIWESLWRSKGAKKIAYTSFGNAIVKELKQRVPPGVEARTIHSMGFKAINQRFRLWGGNRSVNNGADYANYRIERIMEELLRCNDIRSLSPGKRAMVGAVVELVGYCKVNLVGYNVDELSSVPGEVRFMPERITSEQLDHLVDFFEVDLDGTSRDEVYPMVPQVLRCCLDVEKDRYIDFNDMIWLPVALDLQIEQFDLLLGDEWQDVSRCQQALVKKAVEFGRLVLVGDPKQAIYGFAGADCESMDRTQKELEATERGCEVLYLTETRRCGKAIVKEANSIVPDFKAHESNGDGKVGRLSMDEKKSDLDYRLRVVDGDMVLCRVNAPLVSECFKFIKMGKKANIQGRKVGEGLVKTVEKMKAATVGDLVAALQQWHDSEVAKENRKKVPSEAKIINIQDKLGCIMCFVEGVDVNASPELVVQKIDAVFTDDKHSLGIRLSSIHKAKGLEADRVFLLEPEGATVPHPMAKSAWQIEQEYNLRYVAITRAIKELVYVS